MYRFVEYIDQRLDLLFGIVGCLTGAFLAAICYNSSQSSFEIGVAFLVACAIYLLFRNRMVVSSSPFLPSNIKLTLVLNIIFISSFAGSVFVTHFFLYRPPLYFLLISISVAAVVAEILSSESKSQTWLLLLKILLIALNLSVCRLYELPGFIGSDTWSHACLLESWITCGHIAISPSTYTDFPVMHLAVIATRLITSLNLKDSMFLTVGLFIIISILFIFFVVQRLLDRRAGLLAALFISITVYYITCANVLIPNNFSLVFYTMILFFVFKSTKSVTSSLLFVVMAVTLIYTHTIGAFITSITLVVILMANEVYKRIGRASVEWGYISYNIVSLFMVIMLVKWINCAYGGPGSSFFGTLSGWFFHTVESDAEFVGSMIVEESVTPLTRVWFLIFLNLTAIGALSWLFYKMRSNSRLAIISAVFALGIITFILPFFDVRTFIPGRWFAFIVVLCAGLVAQGILMVSGVVNGKIKKVVLVVIIVFAFSTFSFNSANLNSQTPFCEEHSRPAFIQSEFSAVDTISRICCGSITTDLDYATKVFRYAESVLGIQTEFTELACLNPEGEDRVIVEGVKGKSESLVVIRKYLYAHPQVFGEGVELESDFFTKFNSTEYGTMYDNGEVKAYLSK